MNKRLKMFFPAAAVCALLAYTPVAAQEDGAVDGTATEAAASADDGSAFDEFASEEGSSGASEVTVSATPPPAKSAAPVSHQQAQVREPRGAAEGLWFSFGVRGGIGLSSFSGHRPVGQPGAPVILGAGVSGSAGFTAAATSLTHIEAIGTDLSVTLDVQLSGYSALGYSKYFIGEWDGKSVYEENGGLAYQTRTYGGVGVLTIEFPLLARLDNIAGRAAGPLYIEVGPQFGWNAFAAGATKGVTVVDIMRQYRNGFAFGPVLGAGANFGDVLAGVRAFYNVLPYSIMYGGRPWTVQASLTKYFWDY